MRPDQIVKRVAGNRGICLTKKLGVIQTIKQMDAPGPQRCKP